VPSLVRGPRVVARPRLLFVVTEDWYFCSHRLPLARAAQAAGYEVSVVTRVRAHGDAIREVGLRLIPFENARTSLNPLAELWTLIRLIALYRRERPDVVHHVAMKPVLYGSIAARLAGHPHVVNALAGMGWLFSSGAGLARWLQPMVRWGLGRLLGSGITLVQNPDDARLLEQLGVPESHIRRISGSGVDLQLFYPRPEPVGVPVVVLPARLLWDKGVGEFVAAARLLQQKGIAAKFVLAGEPDPANPSAVPIDQISRWVQEGVVSHLGWVDDMPKVLAESHIVCLPSFYGEGIPKSLIEAAAAGRPIVTTDIPGCREIVHHDDNGLLVPPRDSEALAEALECLIKNPGSRQRMGARGRTRAEQEFGLSKVIQQTLALYAEGPG
jgi:glycosyltransferase involved in cell wall biosynthesis